jgi:small redox-active disulfide protein 2
MRFPIFSIKEINMTIKILGSGCCNCSKLLENVKQALSESGKDAEINKVTAIEEIIKYGVMSTPALVVDEKVVSAGKVLKPKDIKKFII